MLVYQRVTKCSLCVNVSRFSNFVNGPPTLYSMLGGSSEVTPVDHHLEVSVLSWGYPQFLSIDGFSMKQTIQRTWDIPHFRKPPFVNG